MDTTTPVAPFTVVSVCDTRDLIEVEDRFVRVPGSGERIPCDHCGRTIEVHATIVDAVDAVWTVGTGCMGADTDRAIRSVVGKAERQAVKDAKAAAADAAAVILRAAVAEVEAMPFPDHLVSPAEVTPSGSTWWHVEGVEAARVLVRQGEDFGDERRRCLGSAWRRAMYVDLVGPELPRLERRAGRSWF